MGLVPTKTKAGSEGLSVPPPQLQKGEVMAMAQNVICQSGLCDEVLVAGFGSLRRAVSGEGN